MRPVSAEHRISQPFGSMKTQGVRADPNPSSGAGYYVHLYGNYQPYGHAGCDIACPEGTPVYAIAAGTVLWADWGTKLPGDETNAGYRRRWYLYKGFPGIVTVIQHAGWIGVYAHLSAAHLNTGDRVTEGQLIGLSGGTGGVAAHLHVEALIDTSYKTGGGLIYGRTDPEPYFAGSGIAAMGETITPLSEEDDMSAKDVWEYPLTIDGKEYPAHDVLRYSRANAIAAKEKADAAPGLAVQTLLATKLPAPDGSGNSYTIAEYITYGWMYAMKAKDNAAAIQPLDPAVLTEAIAKANATAVAERLEITVKAE